MAIFGGTLYHPATPCLLRDSYSTSRQLFEIAALPHDAQPMTSTIQFKVLHVTRCCGGSRFLFKDHVSPLQQSTECRTKERNTVTKQEFARCSFSTFITYCHTIHQSQPRPHKRTMDLISTSEIDYPSTHQVLFFSFLLMLEKVV